MLAAVKDGSCQAASCSVRTKVDSTSSAIGMPVAAASGSFVEARDLHATVIGNSIATDPSIDQGTIFTMAGSAFAYCRSVVVFTTASP